MEKEQKGGIEIMLHGPRISSNQNPGHAIRTRKHWGKHIGKDCIFISPRGRKHIGKMLAQYIPRYTAEKRNEVNSL